jgi:hypothetical protein
MKRGKKTTYPYEALPEKLQNELLANYARLRKSYARYKLTRTLLPRIISESIDQLLKRNSVRMVDFGQETRAICMNFFRDKNAVLIVNSTGKEVHSTLALLSYLKLSLRPAYNIYAVTEVETKMQPSLLKFVSSCNAALCILFEQGAPYLDGFHVVLPKSVRTDRSKGILEFVSSKGHEVGIYLVEKDRPTIQTVHSDQVFLNALTKLVPEVYGFAVSDDIWAGVNASAFVLGDFDLGIAAGMKGHKRVPENQVI